MATTSQAFLGLTMGCARCHDHKYDPFSQREYYQLFAYFNSVTDRGNDGNGGVNAVPSIAVFSSEQRVELERLEDERAAVEEQLLAEDPERLARREAWAQEAAEAAARLSDKTSAVEGIKTSDDYIFKITFTALVPCHGKGTFLDPAPHVLLI